MTISLRDVAGAATGALSMRGVASDNNLPHEPFTYRELITPQYQDDGGTTRTNWDNWVGQHDDDRVRYTPTSRPELVAAVVKMAYSDGEIRAVGSGHSHSNAPAPPEHYIDLNPGDPGDGDSTGLNDVLDHEGWLKDTADDHHLKRVEAGIILRRLNRHILHENGLALENMGSFDGQTVAGAVNTSTHGTGIGLPSFSDSVRSVEIATVPESESGDPIVRLYRIEPEDGITDREAFEASTGDHEMELIQDDDLFHSVVVGYGCMGVVYAYTLEVTDSYWLEERARLASWSTIKQELGTTEQSVKQFLNKNNTRHCQILVNTAAEQVPKNSVNKTNADHGAGQHEAHQDPVCLVRRHVEVLAKDEPNDWGQEAEQVYDERWPPERRKKTLRDIGFEVFNKLHPLKPNKPKANQLHKRFFHPEYRREPFVKKRDKTAWYVALRRLRDRGKADSSEYRHPRPPSPPTMTTEIGVPVGDVVDAVDTFRKKVRNVKQGDDIPASEKNATGEGRDVFFGAPMGVRFTAASEHFLSPEYDRETAMVELPLPVNIQGNETNAFLNLNVPALTQEEMREWVVVPALDEVHDHLMAQRFPTRPHMGKHNTLTAGDLASKYEHFDASIDGSDDVEVGWYQAYERFNAFGTFDNAFTDQLELDNYTPGQTPQPRSTTTASTSTGSSSTSSPSTGSSSTSTEAEGAGPGFGTVGALAGIGAGILWLERAVTDDPTGDTESAGANGSAAGSDPEDGVDRPEESDG